jgi:hypothetical protein
LTNGNERTNSVGGHIEKFVSRKFRGLLNAN